MRHQVVKQPVLGRPEGERLAVAGDEVRGWIEPEPGDFDRRVAMLWRKAS
jgi:hypothetical protein